MNYIIINYNLCFNIFIANMIMAINTKNVDISLIKELQTILLAYSLYNTIIDVIPYLVFILKVLLYSLLYSISVLTYYFLVTTFTFFQRCPPSYFQITTKSDILPAPSIAPPIFYKIRPQNIENIPQKVLKHYFYHLF